MKDVGELLKAIAVHAIEYRMAQRAFHASAASDKTSGLASDQMLGAERRLDEAIAEFNSVREAP